MQEYKENRSRDKPRDRSRSRNSRSPNNPQANPSARDANPDTRPREAAKEEKKRSDQYEVNVQPPNRRISTLKKPRAMNLALQNNPQAIIDTRRNNVWQSDHIVMNPREEDKVQDIQSNAEGEESKILSIVNRELDMLRREQLNDSQDGIDIGVRLLDTPNVNQRNRHGNIDLG